MERNCSSESPLLEGIVDGDSVLRALEQTLQDIATFDEEDRSGNDDCDSYGSVYDSDSDNENSPEMELSAMMNVLVAELQAEIQQEIVNETEVVAATADDEDTSGNDQRQHDDMSSAFVPVSDYTPSKAPDSSAPPLETPLVVAHEQVAKAINKVKLVQILQEHLAKRSKIRKQEIQQELQQQLDTKDDLEQQAPPRATVDTTFERLDAVQPSDPDYVQVQDYHSNKYEALQEAQPTDPDYVPVHDYYSSPTAACLKNQHRSELPPPSTDDSGSDQDKASSPSQRQYAKERRKQQRTKKHKQQRRQQRQKQLQRIVFDSGCLASLQPQGNSSSPPRNKEEAIHRLANSAVWKAICQIVLQEGTK